MKKVVIFLVALCVGLTGVKAMSESELKEKLTDSYTINGIEFKANDQEKVLIERYLDTYEVSSEDADFIYNKLLEAKDILASSGKTKFHDLSKEDKNKIIALVSDVATKTSVDAAIVKGELIVYVPGSDKSEKFYATPVDRDTPIAQTSRSTYMVSFGFVSMFGIAVALRKKNA